MFRQVIVRPHWLHRVSRSPSVFSARSSPDIDGLNSSFTPLLVFINKLSGGQQGERVYHRLLHLLNPRQVFLLENDASITHALNIYGSLSHTRICVCGGDGTAGWILSALARRFPSLSHPPVSVCPLGTGNDLSRVLGWGWHYKDKSLTEMLMAIPNARQVPFDRWQVTFEALETNENEPVNGRCLSCFLTDPRFVHPSASLSYEHHRAPVDLRFTNYLSLGLDAAVILDFHVRRLRDPSRFTSPMMNKLLYLNAARRYFREFGLWRSWHLFPYIRLICDGKNLTDSIRHCHTIVLLNIVSYGSGTRPWPQSPTRTHRSTRSNDDVIAQFSRQEFGDQRIEIFGLDAIQMALIHLGFRGRRIAQCREVRIELSRSMPVHVDGEPFYIDQPMAMNINQGLTEEKFAPDCINRIVVEISSLMHSLCVGQMMDLCAARNDDRREQMTIEQLDRIAWFKTGKTIEAVLITPVILGSPALKNDGEELKRIKELSRLLGILFQMRDDLLDTEGNENIGKPIALDLANHTFTYVSLLGVQGTRTRLAHILRDTLQLIDLCWPRDAETIKDVARHIVSRKH